MNLDNLMQIFKPQFWHNFEEKNRKENVRYFIRKLEQ